MLKIINGYPGSGKSRRMYEYLAEDVKNGKECIFIVPEQQLVVCERQIADLLPSEASLMVEVLSFTRLANRVFRALGGLCFDNMKKGADLLIMWRALGAVAPFLSVWGNTDPGDTSAVSMLLNAGKMMARAGVTPKMLDDTAMEMEGGGKLSKKLSDLALVFSAYNGICKEEAYSSEDDLSRLAGLSGAEEFFRGKSVYIDGFNSLTHQEYGICSMILKGAERVYISINYKKGEDRPIFEKTKGYFDTVVRLAKKSGIDASAENTLRENPNPDIEHLKRELFSPNALQKECGDSVRIVRCKDKSTEMEAVFEDILNYVKNEGGRYSECAIAAPDISAYSGFIRGCSEKYDVPAFTSGRYSVISCSAVRAIRLLLKISTGEMLTEDMIEYAKTGFSDIDISEVSILEKYARAWNINGKKKWCAPWTLNPDGRGAENTDSTKARLEKINEIRARLVSPIENFSREFSKNADGAVKARLLAEELIRLSMPIKLREDAGTCRELGDILGARYHSATWKCIVSCLECAERSLRNTDIKGDVFAKLFDSLINANDVGLIPGGMDEVLTGSIDTMRLNSCKRLYMVGLGDGAFPVLGTGGIFTDGECRILKERDLELLEDSERQLLDSLFSFYTLSCSCEGKIMYTYISSGKKKPSSVLSAVGAVMKKEEGLFEDASENTLSDIMYALLLKEKRENSLKEEGEKNTGSDFDDGMSCAAEHLGEENTERLYGEMVRLSQSKLDRFSRCPFSYACTYVMKLREELTPEISVDIFGTIMHLIFEKFMKLAAEKGGNGGGITDEEAEKIIEDVIGEYYEASGCSEEDDIRIYHLFRRIRATAKYLIKDLRGELSKTHYRPVGFEVGVGRGKTVDSPKLELPDGTPIFVDGVIDRLDTYKDGDGNVYVKIVDYKTGDRDLKLEELEKGKKLQLPLYMSAVCSSDSEELKKLTGKSETGKYIPAGMIYHIAKPPKNTEDRNEAFAQRRGFVLDEEENRNAIGGYQHLKANISLEGMEAALKITEEKVKDIAARMKDGECSVPEKIEDDTCAYCPMYPVCREKK